MNPTANDNASADIAHDNAGGEAQDHNQDHINLLAQALKEAASELHGEAPRAQASPEAVQKAAEAAIREAAALAAAELAAADMAQDMARGFVERAANALKALSGAASSPRPVPLGSDERRGPLTIAAACSGVLPDKEEGRRPEAAYALSPRAGRGRSEPQRFVGNWLVGAGEGSRGLRRRLMACLRLAHRVLGLKRDKLALGQLGGGGALASLLYGASAMALMLGATHRHAAANGASILEDDPHCTNCGRIIAVLASAATRRQWARRGFIPLATAGALGAFAFVAMPDAAYAQASCGGGSFVDNPGGGSTCVGFGSSAAFRAQAFADNAQAAGPQSMAMGFFASTSSGATGSVAIGELATTNGLNSVAIGDSISGGGHGAFAIDNGSVAIGASSQAGLGSGGNVGLQVALGQNAFATADRSTALGAFSTASGVYSLAIGIHSVASAVGANAIGTGAAVGAQALGANSTAVGGSSIANNAGDIAVGNAAIATGTAGTGSATAVGNGVTATGAGAVALGDPSVANGQGAFAAGFNSIATADGTMAGGAANGAVAIGNTAIAAGQGSVALGNTSQAGVTGGTGAIAIGDTAKATVSGGVALGSSSVATNANDVALGTASVTAAANPVSTITINGSPKPVAGTTPTSVVSVGTVGGERQITNVAAGRVTATSTDAVNGSELFQAIQAASSSAPFVSDNTAAAANPSATGANSSAGGFGASATGAKSTVVGNSATDNGNANATVIGNGASVTAGTAGSNVALGQGSAVTTGAVGTPNATIAGTTYTFAGGTPAGVVSFGTTASPRQLTNVAAGQLSATSLDAVNGSQLFSTNTAVNGINTTLNNINNGAGIKYFHANSVLADSNPVGLNSVAIGPLSVATGTDSIAAGHAAKANATADVAIGLNATATGTAAGAATAIGKGAIATGAGAVAFGDPNVANGTGAIAGGFNSIATSDGTAGGGAANGAVAMGNTSIAAGQGSVAIGNTAQAGTTGGTGAIALGDTAKATVSGGVALGSNSVATNANDVALGTSSVTAAANPVSTITVNGSAKPVAGTAPTSVVSVGTVGGERQITNVAAGRVSATSTDAVNGSELFQTIQAISGASAPFVSDNTAAAANPSATGANASAGGFGASATGSKSTVVGNSATDNGNANATVIGNSASIAGGTAGSNVALGQGSTVTMAAVPTPNATIAGTTYTFAGGTPGGVVSVGTAASPRQVTNVAAGQLSANSVDAVNGSQLFSTNSAVNTLNTTVSTITGGGGIKYFHANSVLADSNATGTNAVAIGPASNATMANSLSIGNGAIAGTTAGDVALGAGSTTAAIHAGTFAEYGGAAAGSTTGANGVLSIGTAGNERQIQNVAPGVLSATSTDAVNGSQVFSVVSGVNNLGTSTASALGGGAAYNPATGTISAPAYPIAGTTYTNVGAALNALTGGSVLPGVKYFHANSTLADSTPTGVNSVAIGPASSAGTTNAVSIGNGAIAGANLGDVALGAGSQTQAAVATVNTTINGTTYTFAGTTPTSTVSVGTPGNERTITNVAAGRISGTSTDAVNGSELFATNQAVTALATGAAGPFVSNNAAAAANPVASGTNASAGGFGASATGSKSSVIGNSATDNGNANATVLGNGASITAGTVGSNVAIGQGSLVTAAAVGVPNATIGGTLYTFAGGTPNGVVSMGTAAQPRQVTNVAAGQLSGTSLDAVNGSQLFATNTEVNTLATAITGGAGIKYFHANSALGDSTPTGTNSVAIGPVSTAGANNAVSIGNNATASANAGDVALGANSTTAAVVPTTTITVAGTTTAVAGTTPGSTVSVGAPGAERTITNVAAGRVSATSTDAINGSELNATNTAVNTVNTNVNNLTNTVNNLTTGKAGPFVSDNTAAAANPIASGTNASAGGFGASATGSKSTVVGNAATDNGNANATVLGNGASIAAGVAGSNVAVGQGSTVTTAAVPVAGATIGGTAYTFAGTTPSGVFSVGTAAQPRQVTNVAAGQLSATSLDAVNGSQLFATNTEVNTLATAITGGTGIKYFHANSALADSTPTGTNSVAIGPVSTAGSTDAVSIGHGATASANAGDVALGASSTTAAVVPTTTITVAGTTTAVAGTTPSSTVSVGAPGQERTITNVAAGRVSATSTDAINGSELNATNTAVNTVNTNVNNLTNTVNNLTTGKAGPFVSDNTAAAANPIASGANSSAGGFGASATGAKSTVVGNSATDNGNANATVLGNGASVAAGLAGSNVAIGQGSTVTTAAVGTPNATIGGVTYTFAGGTPGGVVSMGTAASPRQVTNVAAGQLSATSLDAVNGSQLFATNTEVNTLASAITGGTGIKYFHANSALADSTPTGTNSVAIGPVSNAGTTNAVSIGNGAQANTTAGDVALGAGSTTAAIHSGTTAAFGGTAAGSTAGTNGVVSVGSAGNERQIQNVAPGVLSATSTDAVNGSQLFSVATGVNNLGNSVATALGGTSTYNPATGAVTTGLSYGGNTYTSVQNVLTAINPGTTPGVKYFHANSTLADSNPTGTNSVAIGPVSNAGTTDAVSIGHGATAGANGGDVALGAGSTTAAVVPTTTITVAGTTTAVAGTTPGSTVSVGAPGQERTITNVAAGRVSATSTDAVDGSELNATNTAVNTVNTNVNNLTNTVNNLTTGKTGAFVSDNTAAAANPIASGANSSAGGFGASATGSKSTVVGNAATDNGNANATVLGNGASIAAGVAGSNVAVGQGSTVTSAAVATPNATVGGTTYTFAGGTPSGVFSVGTAGSPRQVTNVAAGQLSSTSLDAVNGSQLFATNSAVNGLNTTVNNIVNNGTGIKYFHANSTKPDSSATGTDSIAVGPSALATAQDSMAMGLGASTSTTNSIALGNGATAGANIGDVALGAGATTATVVATTGTTINGVNYSFAGTTPTSTVSVGASGAERTITNVAAGRISATSTDAVNGSELFATNKAVQALATGGSGPVQYSNSATPTTPNGGTATQDVTLVGATPGTPVALHNLANGSTAAGSTDAINGGQLNTGLGSVATALGGGSTYNPATGTVTAPSYSIGGNTYNNVGAALTALTGTGTTAGIKYFHANSTGPDSSAIGTDSVAIGTGATANNKNDVALGANSSTTAAVGTSTVNVNGTTYNVAGTTPVGTVSVGSAGNERTITNVAAGQVNATSTDAINGSELFATNQAVAKLSTGAAGPVQYSNAATPTTPNGGTPTNNVTLVGANPNQPVVISNVAAGVNATDAVNLGQLQTGLAAVNQSTLNQAANYTNQVAAATLASANQYTNQKFNTAMQAAHSAAAVGLAAASLRYDDRPGKLSVAMGGGGWAGAGAGAFGIGYTTEGGRVRLNATGATDGTNFGVGGGLSVTLN